MSAITWLSQWREQQVNNLLVYQSEARYGRWTFSIRKAIFRGPVAPKAKPFDRFSQKWHDWLSHRLEPARIFRDQLVQRELGCARVKLSTSGVYFFTFYPTMHVVLARYCYRKSSVRSSVCLSVGGVDVLCTAGVRVGLVRDYYYTSH